MAAEWERLSSCADNQEVGLEAATLERVRNSSLVECDGAHNSAGQSRLPTHRIPREGCGRGASWVQRRYSASRAGAPTSANAGTSNGEVGCEPPPPQA